MRLLLTVGIGMIIAAAMFACQPARAAEPHAVVLDCRPVDYSVAVFAELVEQKGAAHVILNEKDAQRFLEKVGLVERETFDRVHYFVFRDGHLEFAVQIVEAGIVCVSPAFLVRPEGVRALILAVKGEEI